MAIKLPASARKVLQDKAYGHVVTFGADGRPQATMVWVDAEGDEVLFNTAEGRKKPQNLRRDSRLIISVQDRNNLANLPGRPRERDADGSGRGRSHRQARQAVSRRGQVSVPSTR